MKHEIRKWALLLSAAILSMIAVEVGWRIYLFNFASHEHLARWARVKDLPADAMRYRSHPYLSYCLNPGYTGPDGKTHHNALGFRGPEIAEVKPQGQYRIVCLGGSSTYDTKIEDDTQTFTAQLERQLEQRGHAQVRVINAGVGAYTSWESLVNLQLRVLNLQPDLIIVYHATNDVHARLIPPADYRRDNTGYRRAWKEELRWWDASLFLHYLGVQWGFSQRNLLYAWVNVNAPEALDKPSTLKSNPPRFFRANLNTMVTVAKADGAKVILTSWAWCPDLGDYAGTEVYQQAFREHNQISREVAAAHGVGFYDFATEMPRDKQYWADGRHNNEAGASKKAELFTTFIHKKILSPHAASG